MPSQVLRAKRRGGLHPSPHGGSKPTGGSVRAERRCGESASPAEWYSPRRSAERTGETLRGGHGVARGSLEAGLANGALEYGIDEEGGLACQGESGKCSLGRSLMSGMHE